MSPEDIKKLRKEAGMTQKKLAATIGVSVHAVRKWEQGQRSPGGAAVTLMRDMKKT